MSDEVTPVYMYNNITSIKYGVHNKCPWTVVVSIKYKHSLEYNWVVHAEFNLKPRQYIMHRLAIQYFEYIGHWVMG